MSVPANFENELTSSLNALFRSTKTKAIAYRHVEYRMHEQLFDIFVDTRGIELYLAIECKSIDYSKIKRLYFSQHFKSTKDGHQIERESQFLWCSGRAGILAVELRNYTPRKRLMALLGWPGVYHRFYSNEASLPLEDLDKIHTVERIGKEWQLTLEDLLTVNYLNRAPEPKKYGGIKKGALRGKHLQVAQKV